MSPKKPEDEERRIHQSETEVPIDQQSTADKIGSQAVSGANRDGGNLRSEYQQRIDKILSAPLTPETFDGYAEDALNEVIAVADDMIVQYLQRRGLTGMPVNGLVEDSIAGHYGVSIDEILDDLTKKKDQLSKIQRTVEQANKDKTVYVPPDESKVKITDGLVEFDPAEKSPKVETILFMLQQQYELDPNDAKDIKLISGTVTPEMMRNEPYILIDIPSLNRIILACNEKRNITYVFDQEKIKEAEISLDKLVDYTKKQLDALIKDFESIGIRITHTSKYLPKIEEALSSIKHFAKTGEKAIDDNPEIQNPTLLTKRKKWKDKDEIIALAMELSPDEPLTFKRVNELSKEGLLPSERAISNLFGSLREFQKVCGFDVKDWSKLGDDEIIALAKELSPVEPLTQSRINELSKEGKFMSNSSIARRFGSLKEFQKICGFDVKDWSKLGDDEIIALAKELSPDEPLTQRRIDELSKEGEFMSNVAIRNRFGSLREFQKICGFDE